MALEQSRMYPVFRPQYFKIIPLLYTYYKHYTSLDVYYVINRLAYIITCIIKLLEFTFSPPPQESPREYPNEELFYSVEAQEKG